MPTVAVNFIPCAATPNNGYKLTWRVQGSSDPYTDAGFYTESPIVFVDELNPDGTCYEGFLQADCTESGESGSLVGNAIPWATDCLPESGEGFPVSARFNGSLVDHCSLSGTTVYTDDGTIATGKTVYTDSGMTTELIGYDFISDIASGIVFNINSGNGLVGSDTGLAC